MTATEMALEFRQRANCVQNYTISTNSIQSLLNQAAGSLVRDLSVGKFQKPTQRNADNENKYNDDVLAPLRKEVIEDTNSTGFVPFEQNHWYLESVEVLYPKCYPNGRKLYKTVERTVPNEIGDRTVEAIGTYNEVTWNRATNPDTPPQYLYNPRYIVTGKSLPAGVQMYPEYKYNLKIRYIERMPDIQVRTPIIEQTINATNPAFVVVPADVNCILPDSLHSEIVDRAVLMFNRAGGNYTDMQVDKSVIDSGLS